MSQKTVSRNTSPAERARARVEELKGFYGNLFWYVVVIASLGIFNYLTSPEFYWVIFPALGWGLGVCLHGFAVFFGNTIWGRWEKRKTAELTRRYEAEEQEK